ncbi:uncharacterized protein zgc:193711 isoform X1 [Danio aesculapii]|uniref:uncharacterized protein zgc:193711 isoform X1 n=1 Tax=Danio aesculapii TaxID=1142201 RepID=UPI0024C043B2|nr:uncharacterized protein zgc:193711 isoform X1 [Danio aesculapii]
MGSHVTKTLDKWGINPRKLSQKRAKGKAAPPSVPSHQQAHVDIHVYDCVTSEPQYAQVNKKRKPNEDGLHYADVQVLQSENVAGRENRQISSVQNTQYATIDFTTPAKTQTSAEPADLFIPPGELPRPRMSQKKNVHSKRA